MSEPSRPAILVWRLGALGDTLLLLPALAALRAAHPRVRIVAAGNPTAFEPALWSALVDDVVDATAPRLAGLASGQAPPPGALPYGITTAVVWSSRSAEIARGLHDVGVKQALVAPPVPDGRIPAAAFYLATLEPLGVSPVPFALEPPPAALSDSVGDWTRAVGGQAGPIVVFHAGAGSPLKRWPLPSFVDLARRLRADGCAVVWTTGPDDLDLREALAGTDEARFHLSPADVPVLCAHLSRTALVLSGDCGVAHLAALAGTPTVTLFGPTDQEVWAPPGRRGIVLRLALPCSPCGALARACPSRMCLRGLSVERVRAAVLSHLRASGGPATGAGGAGMDRYPAPSTPAAYRLPLPAPAPPAPLQVSNWAPGRTREAPPSPAPG